MNVKVIDKIDVVVIDDFLDLMSHTILKNSVLDCSNWGLRESISVESDEGDPSLYYGFFFVNCTMKNQNTIITKRMTM